MVRPGCYRRREAVPSHLNQSQMPHTVKAGGAPVTWMPFLSQEMIGGGSPVAEHCSSSSSPRATVMVSGASTMWGGDSTRSSASGLTAVPYMFLARESQMWRRFTILYSASKSSIRRFVITEKAPTRAFSWLKAATTAFTFKTLLRHYAKWALTPRSLNVKLGPQLKGHKGRTVWLA